MNDDCLHSYLNAVVVLTLPQNAANMFVFGTLASEVTEMRRAAQLEQVVIDARLMDVIRVFKRVVKIVNLN